MANPVTEGVASGSQTTFTWKHVNPVFVVEAQFTSDFKKYRVRITTDSSWQDGSNHYGYIFCVAASAISVNYKTNDFSNCLVYWNGEGRSYTRPSTSWSSYVNAPSYGYCHIYAKCQASITNSDDVEACDSNSTIKGIAADTYYGDSGTFATIIRINMGTPATDCTASPVYTTGSTHKSKITWSGGSSSTIGRLCLYENGVKIGGESYPDIPLLKNEIYVFGSLVSGHSYDVRPAYKLDDSSNWKWCNAYMFTTPSISCQYKTITSTSVKLRIRQLAGYLSSTDPKGSGINCWGAKYKVTKGSTLIIEDYHAKNSYFDITGLSPNTTYNIYLSAVVDSSTKALVGYAETGVCDCKFSDTFTTPGNPASGLTITITGKSGKRIFGTVKWTAGGESGLKATVKACTSNSASASAVKSATGLSSGSSFELQDLTDGTTYYLFAYLPGSTGSFGSYTSTTMKSVTTYSCTVSIVSRDSTSIVIKVTGNNSWSSGDVIYWVNNYNDTATVKSKTSGTGNLNTTITGLTAGTTYKVHACLGTTDNVSATNPKDAMGEATVTTASPASNLSLTITGKSGKRIYGKISWTENGEYDDEYPALIKVCKTNSVSASSVTTLTDLKSGDTFTISDLDNGTTYYLFAKIPYSAGSFADFTTTASASVTTYKCTVSMISVGLTTATIKVSGNNSWGTKDVTYWVADPSGTLVFAKTVGSGDTNLTINSGISPGTTYTAHACLGTSDAVSATNPKDAMGEIQFTTESVSTGLTVSVTSKTGKTVTGKVSWTAGGDSGSATVKICSSNSASATAIKELTGISNGSTFTFSDLTNGTTYYIFAKLPSSSGDYKSYTSGASRSTTTYSCSITPVSSTSTSLTIKVNGNNSWGSGTITYWVNNSTDSSTIKSKTTDYGDSSIVIDGLSSNTTYNVHACLGNSSNSISGSNPTDATNVLKATTGASSSGLVVSVTSKTGKTVTGKVSWTSGSDTGTATVKICSSNSASATALYETSSISNGGSFSFSNLSNGTTYYIFAKLPSSTGSYQSYTSGASTSFTTYSCTINKEGITATSVVINVTGNNSWGTGAITYWVNDATDTTAVKGRASGTAGSSITISGLTAGTTYKIHACLGSYAGTLSQSNPNDATDVTSVNSGSSSSGLLVTISSRTGKTVDGRVSWTAGGETGTATVKICTSNSYNATAVKEVTGIANGSTFSFTGLNTGTNYYVFAKLPSSSGDYKDYTAGASASTTTYACYITKGNVTPTSVSITVTGNNSYTGTVTYWVTNSSGSTTVKSKTTATAGNNISITGLTSGTSYMIYACLGNDSNSLSQSNPKDATASTTADSSSSASGLSVYVSSRTGKTVSGTVYWVNGGETGLTASVKVCSTNSPSATPIAESTGLSNNASFSFNGLNNGTTYYIFAKLPNSAGDFKNYTSTAYTYFTTYSCSISRGSTTATSMTITVTGNNSWGSGTITYWVKDSTDSTTVKSATTANANSAITISGLTAGTSYVVHACLGNDSSALSQSNPKDATASTSGSSASAASGLYVSVSSRTGKTITGSVSWSAGGESGLTATVKVCSTNSYNATAIAELTGITGSFTFTGLSKATTYYIFAKLPNSAGDYKNYTSSVYTYTTTYTTYITNIKSTATTLSCSFSGNNSYSGTYKYKVTKSDGTQVVGYTSSTGSMSLTSGITANNTYTIYAYLEGVNSDTESTSSAETQLPAAPGITTVEVTGTSIYIKPSFTYNGSASVTWTAKIDGGSSVTKTSSKNGTQESHRFTGLANGSSHTITFTASDGSNTITIPNVTAKTYALSLVLGKAYSKKIDGSKVTYTDGLINGTSANSSKSSAVQYWITNSSGTVVVSNRYLDCSTSNPCTFNSSDTLNPSTTYTMHVQIQGIEYPSGTNDTHVSASFTTNSAPKDLKAEFTTTGTTISITPTWVASKTAGGQTESTNIVTCTCVISGNGAYESLETTTSGATLWFTNLENGKNYTISYTAVDNEGNVLAYASGYNGQSSQTTYEVTVTIVAISTRSVTIKVESNKTLPSGRKIALGLKQGSTVCWAPVSHLMNSGQSDSYITLEHDSDISYEAYIQDMKDRANKLDTVKTGDDHTKELTVVFSGYTRHVHSLNTRWQAKANGENYNKCPISNVDISFVSATIKATDEGAVDTYDGNYATDRTMTFTGLTGGKHYEFGIVITDGINTNIAEAEGDLKTVMQTIQIYDPSSRTYKNAIAYVYTSGKWWRCVPHINNNASWRESSPTSERDGVSKDL